MGVKGLMGFANWYGNPFTFWILKNSKQFSAVIGGGTGGKFYQWLLENENSGVWLPLFNSYPWSLGLTLPL